MLFPRRPRRAALLFVGLLTSAQAAVAQVEVNAGETMTQSDLVAGVFGGQAFTLDTNLVINVNDGGRIGTVGVGTNPFNFNGSTVNIRGNAEFLSTLSTKSYVTDLQLLVEDGGSVGSGFSAFGAVAIDLRSGSIGTFGRLANGSTLRMMNGSIGPDFWATQSGSHVEILGGAVQSNLRISTGASVAISGGVIGSFFTVGSGSTALITGGTIGNDFTAISAGAIDIWGGQIGSGFYASQSTVNLFVTSLTIDGSPIALDLNDPLVIATRGGALLEATLADGSFFDLRLNTDYQAGQDYITTATTLTATLVPTPSSAAALAIGWFIASRRRRAPAVNAVDGNHCA